MFDWNSFWTVFGICVAFGGALLLDRMFPNIANKPVMKVQEEYVPNYIDRVVNVVMKKK